jgi:hypothetical protein
VVLRLEMMSFGRWTVLGAVHFGEAALAHATNELGFDAKTGAAAAT